ncbi:chitin synthase-domain-containing protein [Cantharellus anzutake]|uniref:chitin synthase-domain-containing protein n=1 Tax=Cantharellus anzutake TaxID=1750568 RepID=UPI001903671B|nr:chitin synthase-domain-containing protein [Cantharellus anzutake]KAF8313908.1 chitin synthase-domain-containing protein [Cantharellus anzutake]
MATTRTADARASEDDLATLPSISDDTIVSRLRDRFLNDIIYTSVGSSTLVALNPHKYVGSNADSVLLQYATEYRDTSGEKEYRSPHIFQLANNAYYHMRRTGQDQSLLFSGETGAGKSESRRLAIKSVIELSVSNPGKKGSKLASQIPSADFILESFGNARTLFNPNASRFGRYTELQFSDRGRLYGAKTLDYYLEKSRVAGAPSGERNFHIFYYLLTGATNEERQHLHLSDKVVYRYLTHGGGNPFQEDDGHKFERLKHALKSVGFSKRSVAQTCQLIAAIIHLGNIEFTRDRNRNEDAAVVRNTDVLNIVAEFLGVSAASLESVLSYKTKLVKKELCTIFLDPEGASDNRDDLAKNLYSLLFSWLNEFINQKLCRDDYTTFVGFLDFPGFQNITSSPSRSNSLDQFCINYANERLHQWVRRQIFDRHADEFVSEGLSGVFPTVPYFDNSECVRMLSTMPGGIIHIMDDQVRRMPKKTDHTMIEAMSKRWGNHTSFRLGGMDHSGFPTFTVSHYAGPVTYSAESFLEKNAAAFNPDFVSLLRRSSEGGRTMGGESSGSSNHFIQALFSSKSIATEAHPRHDETIVAAHQPVKPMRAPSMKKRGTVKRRPAGEAPKPEVTIEEEADEGPADTEGIKCVAGEFKTALDVLFETLDETNPWSVMCINPNDAQLPNQLETRGVKAQIRSAGLSEVSRKNGIVIEASMTPAEFCDRYRDQLREVGLSPEDDPVGNVRAVREALGLSDRDVVVGNHKVFLSQVAFHKMEDYLRANDAEEQKRNRLRVAEAQAGLLDVRTDEYGPYGHGPDGEDGDRSPVTGYNDPFGNSSQVLPLVSNAQGQPFVGRALYGDDDDGRSLQSDDFDQHSRITSGQEDASNYGSESYAPSRNMFQNTRKVQAEKDPLPGDILQNEVAEEVHDSSARRRWLALVWLLTWWLPTPLLTYIGRMKRMDIRQAWREKLAINILIWFVCASAIFVIAILGYIICPHEYVFSPAELKSHSYNNDPKHTYTAIRGEVFDLTGIMQTHVTTVSVIPQKTVMKYGGLDATSLFPVQVSALCEGVNGPVNPYVLLSSTNQSVNVEAQYHDFRAFNQYDYRPDWYFEMMILMRYNWRVGFVGYTASAIRSLASKGRAVAVYNGMVYDLSDYINFPPVVHAPDGTQVQDPNSIKTLFMESTVVDLFRYNNGQDITNKLNNLQIDSDTFARMQTCLRNLFLIGKVDNRNSPQCLFSTYILLALSAVMVAVIGFKFIASITFASPRRPEDHDKFVICQVPVYTEDEDSVRRTIDSLAKLRYDDKRKLLFIICDGNIVGSGNDRPTPRIVLDVLGADPNLDPEPLSFLSLGEGAKQHNMGKVYSGLYECSGHVVPYVVLVKVGKPTERSRPGNRGKRDSQMVLMHFLNKVHFNSAMNPCELEMYHQIKNVIGVNPSFYEYIFMVDADTTVEPLALNRLVSAMIHDKKVLGVCGETSLSNEKRSVVTMMQVYEYFISHHLAKSFESLFGSVTCLPGCFTMYRLRTPDTHKPLFISNAVIEDYSENRVDTLHMKNLLHLGEDRYLTTLLLKHFPNYKTQFVRDAHAYTIAPEEWKILLSQRRRWINSTVHNLAELVFLDQLCGFCCFSMRFIVFIDLLSTIIQPVTVAYIVYLIYLVVGKHESVPLFSIIMLAAIYGLQALVFIFRRKWDMIGWMLFYILAIPVFSFYLPLYAFWRMDDFSWGQTRIVMGEKGKKLVIHDEGKFDPRSIPLKSWTDYENELWDKESNHSVGSWVPPTKGKDGYHTPTASIYGRQTVYDAHEVPYSRSYSPAPSYNGRQPSTYGFPQAHADTLGRQSMAGVQSRPTTSYLPDIGGGGFSGDFLGSPSGQPSDAELERAVQEILRDADLNVSTKRAIRSRLEESFGIDLTARKTTINAAIDRILLTQAQ